MEPVPPGAEPLPEFDAFSDERIEVTLGAVRLSVPMNHWWASQFPPFQRAPVGALGIVAYFENGQLRGRTPGDRAASHDVTVVLTPVRPEAAASGTVSDVTVVEYLDRMGAAGDPVFNEDYGLTEYQSANGALRYYLFPDPGYRDSEGRIPVITCSSGDTRCRFNGTIGEYLELDYTFDLDRVRDWPTLHARIYEFVYALMQLG